MSAEVERFLRTVVTTDEGFFCLLLGPPFQKEWFKWPDDIQKIVDRADALSTSMNVYFSPHLFREPSLNGHTVRESVLQTRTIVADLDNADVTHLSVVPTMLVESSPGRHQGYWVLKEQLPLNEIEELSKRNTYSIPDCDHSGWHIGHLFRLPGTQNHKYTTKPLVKIAGASYQPTTADDLREHTKEVDYNSTSLKLDDEWIVGEHWQTDKPQELFEKFRREMPAAGIVAFSRVSGATRSEGRWALMCGLFRAGASRDEVFALTKLSPNNSYNDNLFGGDTDLAKDVLRAERAVAFEARDIGTLISNILRAPGNLNYKMGVIAKVVIEDMEKNGEFVVTSDGRSWYLHTESGRPMTLARHSDFLDSLLDTRYHLNSTEKSTAFVIAAIIAFTIDRGRQADTAVLSHMIDDESMLVHTGHKDVFKISATGEQERISDGQLGVLFPWRVGDEPFAPRLLPKNNGSTWCDYMFDGFFDNLIGLDPGSAKALMRVWVLFTLFKDKATARPLLAVFGQPGSGKSTILRMLYTLFYGPRRSLNSITTAEDFDSLVSSDPFVAFDNVDTWANWLADKLALSASTSDLVKRKLYTDSDVVVIKRQAVVAISAHNPRFGREDVVDRMLMLNFERLSSFEDEQVIINKVSRARNNIWGEILEDCAKVLRQPDPDKSQIPQFRIQDFSTMGTRIAQAVGVHEGFVNAVTAARVNQVQFNLGEEDILLTAVRRWHETRNLSTLPPGELFSPSQLFDLFDLLEPSFKTQYRNPIQFSKKLWTLQDTLKQVFDVTFVFDTKRQTRLWRIEPSA